MEKLEQTFKNHDISIYEIKSRSFKKYIFSSKETRLICNHPEICGYQFSKSLRVGISKFFKYFPERNKFENIPDKNVTIIIFLRGGLNFGLREILGKVYKYNRHYSTFITSQRYRVKRKWSIKQDQYQKFSIPNNVTLFLGDVIATGTTMENGLKKIYHQCLKENRSIKNFIVITIGSDKVENILEKYDTLFKKSFNYENSYLIYIEGKFTAAEKDNDPPFSISGTDLLKYPALLTPEYELSQYDNLSIPLERCAIYDVGTRSFHFIKYLDDVKEYWLKLFESNFTLEDIYKKRFPEKEYTKNFKEFSEYKKNIWTNISDDFLKELYSKYNNRWNKIDIEKFQSNDFLKDLAINKIKKIEDIMR